LKRERSKSPAPERTKKALLDKSVQCDYCISKGRTHQAQYHKISECRFISNSTSQSKK
jgi:hypothetical protein